jgi:hypothetical protein
MARVSKSDRGAGSRSERPATIKLRHDPLVQHSWAERPDAAHQNLMDIEKQIRSVTKGAYNKSPDWAAGA